MAETPDVIAAMLHVASNSAPFNLSGANPLYEAVQFKRGFQRGSVATPTLALYEFGGTGARKGLGTVDQWRSLTVRCDLLAETRTDAVRIWEKVRAAWQADFNCEAGGVAGTVGSGHVRETGGVKDMEFSEAHDAPWDETGRVFRLVCDVSVRFGD